MTIFNLIYLRFHSALFIKRVYRSKKILIFLLLNATVMIPVFAQQQEQDKPQTIFQSQTSNYHRGRFFSPEVRVHFYGDDIETSASPLIGGTFGWIFNRSFLVGLGGFGKVARTRFRADYPQRSETGQVLEDRHPMGLGYGYGGVVLGYVSNSNKPIHFTFPVLIGFGTSNEYEIEPDGDHGTTINSPGFFIVEPGVNMEINLVQDLRLELGVTYRHIDTSQFEQISSGDLNGLGLRLGIKTGRL